MHLSLSVVFLFSRFFFLSNGRALLSTAIGGNNYTAGSFLPKTFFSFAADPNVKNYQEFVVKIIPLNNNTGTSGNDTIDSVSMMGIKQWSNAPVTKNSLTTFKNC